MKFTLRIIIFVAIGAVLASAGIGLANWQFYAVLVLATIVGMIEAAGG